MTRVAGQCSFGRGGRIRTVPPAATTTGVARPLGQSSFGRGGRIRTDDHHTPSVVRYQAALRPVRARIVPDVMRRGNQSNAQTVTRIRTCTVRRPKATARVMRVLMDRHFTRYTALDSYESLSVRESTRMDRWYAVFTKPRQEHVAEEHLERQAFTVWLPRLEHSVRHRGRWVDRIEPLFPRYLFLQADAADQDLSTIRSTRGVTGLVRQGIEPAVVPEQVISFLRETADPESGLHHIGSPARFKRGDRVRVIEGPFEGLEGVLLKEKGEERVLVLLAILGGERNVALSTQQLMRARG